MRNRGAPQQRTAVRTARTLLVVFQRGRQLWSQGASLAALGEEVRRRCRCHSCGRAPSSPAGQPPG